MINLLGNVVPMVFAILTIPLVIGTIGNEKFAVLTIAWLFLGYFSILDLGIGRATTKFVIEYHHKGLVNEVVELIYTSVLLLFFFGVMVGAALYFMTPYICDNFLNIPSYLKKETRESLRLIAGAIPFVIGVAGVRGVLEAHHQFRLLNIIKIPSSVLNYLIPAITGLLVNSLTLIVFFLALTRVILFIVYSYYCFKPLQHSGAFRKFNRSIINKLVSYGGWLTISNLIGPIMIYFDRFIIGSVLTLTMLSYYTTPYEVITKLLVVAGSATGVLFPVFAKFFLHDKLKLTEIYSLALKGIVFIMLPVCLFFSFFSHEILSIWLGDLFAENSSMVLQLLCLGILFNSIASIPYTSLQALNRPDIPAKIHLIELPFYLAALTFFASRFGIQGVAFTWMIRNFIDAILFLLANNYFTYGKLAHGLRVFILLFLVLFFYFAASFILSDSVNLLLKIPLFLSMLIFFILIFWFKVISGIEKSTIQEFFKKQHESF